MTSRLGVRWTLVLTGLLVFLVAIGGLTSIQLLRVSDDLHEARDLMEEVSTDLRAGQIEAASRSLATAEDRVLSANRRLQTALTLQGLSLLPVGSQSLDSLRESVGLAASIIHGGRRILAASASLAGPDGRLEVSLDGGTVPIATVAAAADEIDDLLLTLPGSLDDAHDGGLLVLGPIKELHREVVDEALDRRAELRAVGRGLRILEDLAAAGGSRRFLIAAANTAEMRGSGGMVLSYGTLVSKDGEFDLEHFGPIDELALKTPVPRTTVPRVPDDYLKRWDGFDPLLRWRNATMSGDFTISAPVLSAMYRQATGRSVDGVIQVDPQGLAAILEGTGPVQVPELGEVTADNVVPLVLNEAYLRFPDVEQRRDVLSDVTHAVFDKLVNGSFTSLRPLAEALVATAAGRHLLMSTTSTTAEDALRSFDADGALPDPTAGDAVQLTVQNLSGNKLDYYVDTGLDLRGDRPPGAFGEVEATVVVTNTAPVGAVGPRYIFGPFDATHEVGSYRALVTLYLPAGTTLQGASGDGGASTPTSQTEDQRPLVSWTVEVPAGATKKMTLELRLPPRPPGNYTLLVVPTPRVRPTSLDVDLTADPGRARVHTVVDRPIDVASR